MKTDHTVDEPAAGHSEQDGRDQKLHRLTLENPSTGSLRKPINQIQRKSPCPF